MLISCQGDFEKQVQKLVKFLLYTAENWWGKDQFCVRSVRSLQFEGWHVFFIFLFNIFHPVVYG
jgi:hypothetical protein